MAKQINNYQCEPSILANTGLTVDTHLRRTVDNFAHLRDLASDLPFVPVIQGWATSDYLRCLDDYARHGIDLTSYSTVGVGSVCRRQASTEARAIFTALHDAGLHRLHGFGVKITGLRRYGALLSSADSLAWSFDARRDTPLPGCRSHINCANCSRYALAWRARLLATTNAGYQPSLFSLTGSHQAAA